MKCHICKKYFKHKHKYLERVALNTENNIEKAQIWSVVDTKTAELLNQLTLMHKSPGLLSQSL